MNPALGCPCPSLAAVCGHVHRGPESGRAVMTSFSTRPRMAAASSASRPPHPPRPPWKSEVTEGERPLPFTPRLRTFQRRAPTGGEGRVPASD